MHKLLITGAGNMGSLIACLFASTGEYEVYLADLQFQNEALVMLQARYAHLHLVKLDVKNKQEMIDFLTKHAVTAVLSSLPYFCNHHVAEIAKQFNLHYFDLTEDVETTRLVKELAVNAKTAFVPQCGLAPGFINIAAQYLMQHFESLDTVKLRAGALPISSGNSLHYALTWSTDGLINEYSNECFGIENGRAVTFSPLEGYEILKIAGECFEAFNTSGGLGSLSDSYLGKVKNLSYKTLRYVGHCEKMRFLLEDLRLNEDRATLKRILESAIPTTKQDVVIVYVSVTGIQQDQLTEETYVKKIYPQTIADISWSAIQVATAAGACGVVDMVINNPNKFQGFVLQERFSLTDFLENRFGKYYA